MLDDFRKLVYKSIQYDPWVRNAGIAGYLQEMHNEIEEALDALERDDIEHFKEEVGDVFMDYMHLIGLAHEKGMFTFEEVLVSAANKIHARKPYVGEGRQVTLQEATDIWEQSKRKKN